MCGRSADALAVLAGIVLGAEQAVVAACELIGGFCFAFAIDAYAMCADTVKGRAIGRIYTSAGRRIGSGIGHGADEDDGDEPPVFVLLPALPPLPSSKLRTPVAQAIGNAIADSAASAARRNGRR